MSLHRDMKSLKLEMQTSVTLDINVRVIRTLKKLHISQNTPAEPRYIFYLNRVHPE